MFSTSYKVHRDLSRHLRATELGVGVQRTRLRSFCLVPSHPDMRPIASARRVAAVPIVVRSSNRFAAGVSDPDASARRGVIDGGPMSPLRRLPLPARRPALVRKDFAADDDRRCDSASRAVGPAIRNGVFGVSAGSSDWDSMRGVPVKVPHVISCLTAEGPSSDGVGDGMVGT